MDGYVLLNAIDFDGELRICLPMIGYVSVKMYPLNATLSAGVKAIMSLNGLAILVPSFTAWKQTTI